MNVTPNNGQPIGNQRVEISSATSIGSAQKAINQAAQPLSPPLPLDECPMTGSEIKKNTQLGKINVNTFPDLAAVKNDYSSNELDEFIKFAANMLGGGLISGGQMKPNDDQSSVDGMLPLPNYAGWNWLLKTSDHKMIKRGIKQLLDEAYLRKSIETDVGNMHALRTLALDVSNRVKNLKAGEFELLFGGYSNRAGGSGHAIVYEICRAEDGTYDLYICTATGFQLTDTIQEGDKERLKPVVHYKGVTEDELLFNSDGVVRPAIIQSLIELKTLSSWDNNFIVDEEDVLEIFDTFAEKRVNVNIETYGAITGQRSGSCVPSSTKCWIRKKLGNIDTYKREMFEVKLRLLQVAYEKLRGEAELDTPRGALSRRLLEQVARKVLRRVAKLRDRNAALIPEERAKEAAATAFDVINQVKTLEEMVIKKRQGVTLNSDVKDLNILIERQKRANTFFSTSVSPEGRGLDPFSIPESVQNLEETPLAEFLGNIRAVINNYNYYVTIFFQSNYIHASIDQIPLPEIEGISGTSEYWTDQIKAPFWENFTKEEMENAIVDLEEIAYDYKQGIYSQDLKTRQEATLLAIHTLIHFLALKLDRFRVSSNKAARLENYKTPYRGLAANNYTTRIYLDSKEFDRIQKANQYFKAFNAKAPYGVLFENENDSEIVKTSVVASLANGQFWENLWLEDKKLCEVIDRNANSRWKDLTDQEIDWDYRAEKSAYEEWLRKVKIEPDHYRWFQPKTPERKVNLPQNQKRVMILEEQKVLENGTYRYLNCLSNMAHLSNESMLALGYFSSHNRISERKSPYSTDAVVQKSCSTKDWDSRLDLQIATFNSQLLSVSRKIGDWNKRSAEVKALEKEIKDPLLKKFFRTLSQWKLSPNQLIYEAGKNFDVFGSTEMQALFFNLFFRSPVSEKDEAKLGAGALLLEDDSLLENSKVFIQKGLAHNYKILKNGGEERGKALSGSRFFFEFAAYLAKYLVDGGQEKKARGILQVEELNRFLSLEGLTEKDRDALHQCRLLYYTTFDPKLLEANQLSEIYQSLCYHRVNSGNQTKVNRILTEAFIAKLTVACKKEFVDNEELRNKIGGSLLKFFNAHNVEEELEWLVDANLGYPILSAACKDEESYQVNLATGKLYINYSPMKGVPSNRPWESQADFIRIFKGDKDFDYQATGNGIITFHHKVLGSVRLSLGENSYSIERQFPGSNRWYAYKNIADVQGFPQVLSDNHTFWAPMQASPYKGYFVSLDEHQRKYALCHDGEITEVESLNGESNRHSRIIDGVFGNDPKVAHLTLFDKKILLHSDRHNVIKKVSFPRYTSLEGNPLVFTEEGAALVWNDNRQYTLPEKMPKGFLGNIPNYLYLNAKDRDESDKLLVPLQRLDVAKVPFANGEIAADEGSQEWRTQKYVSYDVEPTGLKPTSKEAKLYLAYVHLSQKNYAQAVSLIRQGNNLEKLSPISLHILKMIMDLPKGEDHPELKMVQLQAYCAFVKEQDLRAVKKIDHYFEDLGTLGSLLISVQESLQSLNSVSVGCRLSDEEEKLVLTKLLKEGKAKSWKLNKQITGGTVQEIFTRMEKRLCYLKSNRKSAGRKTVLNGERSLPSIAHGRYHERIRNCPDSLRPFEWHDMYPRYRDEENIKKTAWFHTGEIPKLYTRPYRKDCLEPNGKLFLHAYHIAKKGTSAERKELLYQLKQHRIHANFPNSNDTYAASLDLMIIFLLHPEEFPVLPSNLLNRSYAEQAKFLRDVCDCSKKKMSSREVISFFSVPSNTLKDTPNDAARYPHPKTSAFDENPRELQGKRQLLSVDLEMTKERWNELENWRSYLLVDTTKGAKKVDFNLHFDPSILSENEQNFSENLQRDLKELKVDFDRGKEINSQTPNVNITNDDCEVLHGEVAAKIAQLEKQLEEKNQELLQKFNKEPKDALTHLAKLGGGAKQKIGYRDSVACLLSLDKREYKLKNPELNDGEIQELSQLSLQVSDLKSHIAQLHRIKTLTEKIYSSEATDLTREHFCQELNFNLNARYEFEGFDQETQVALRIFSGETGMIPHKKQTDLIKKMTVLDETDPSKFKDIVIQLIMGGGKTSVLATLLMYLSAKKEGRLALFIVPASLYDTVKINLGTSFDRAFHQELNSFDFSREEMTEYKLNNLLALLNKAKETCLPIVVKASTIQALELETLSFTRGYVKMLKERDKTEKECEKLQKEIAAIEKKLPLLWSNQRKHCEAEDRLKVLKNRFEIADEYYSALVEGCSKAITKLELLRSIVSTLPETADALIDEVDLALDALQQVNFPEGDRVKIPAQRNALLHLIYKTLVRDDLDQVVGLLSNNQSKMSKETYLNEVVPKLAEEVAEKYEPIHDFIIDYRRPFLRFVTGKTPIFLEKFLLDKNLRFNQQTLTELNPKWKEEGTFSELQEDLGFLFSLETLYNSEDEEKKEAANSIALARHFLIELTPATLSKSGRRDYGVKLGSDGKIIPYLAVHVPAKTEFGYHWEEACYFYQWAAAFAPDEKQIESLVKSFEEMAHYYVQKNGESFEETVEYKTFFKLFGIPLDKIHEPGNIEKAVDAISSHVENSLDLQFENVARNVSFNAERLTSNGANLVSQQSSRRVMSGTPWNVEGYPKKLAERFEADLGTEGRILHALAAKEKEGKIHTANLDSVTSFLTSIYENHPNPEKIRGIIETGGLFKVFKTNFDVAKEIMHFYELHKINEEIEGVLFFHNDPGQDEPDTLYVWKKGAYQPERVGGSSVDALKAKGLNPKKYFTFYDERHTTGQDILQVSDAVNLITFDESMLRRTFTQGIMRLRQFLSTQEVEVVTTEEAKALLYNEGQTFEDLAISAEKAQSLRKAPNMVLHYQQQIDDIPRKYAIQKVLQALKTKDNSQIVKTVEKYEPFFVTKMADMPYLQFGRLKKVVSTKTYLQNQLNRIRKNFMDIAKDDPELLKKVEAEFKEMAEHIETSECLPTEWEEVPKDLGVQQEIEVHQLVQVRQQVEINYELEQEVELELKRYEMIKPIIHKDETKMTMEKFKELLQDMKAVAPASRTVKEQLQQFEYGFDNERIPYERAFSEPIYGTLPYFQACTRVLPVFHKLQRPPKQILAIRADDGMRWLLVSEFEAKAVKRFLMQLYKEKNPLTDDVWFIQPDGSKLVSDGDLTDEFSMDSPGVAEGLLEINAFTGNADYLDKHAGDTEDWLRENPELKVRFLKLKVARDKEQNEILRRCQVVMGHDEEQTFNPTNHTLRERAEKEQKNQGNYEPANVDEIPVKKVKDLKAEYVPYLKTKEQLNNLRLYHGPFVTPEQVPLLEPGKVEILEKPEQAALLNEEQAKGLKKRQHKLIASVNPDYYKNFTERWQVEAVPVEYINKIDANQMAYLSKKQLKKVTKEMFQDLPNFKVTLPPEKYGWLPGNLITIIPENFLNFVLRDQVVEINDPETIQKLEVLGAGLEGYELGTWTNWINPEMVPFIDFETQLPLLEAKELITRVPVDEVKGLSELQIASICQKQVKGLTVDQLPFCPNPLIQFLTPDQILHLIDEQYPFLRGEEQIQAVSSDKFAYLRPEQMQWISDAQYRDLTIEQVGGLNNRQLLEVSKSPYWSSIQEGLTIKQIHRFDTQALIDILTIDQIGKFLKETQVKFLEREWQVQACADNLVRILDSVQITKISDEQVPHLVGEHQVKHIKNERFPHLVADQMKWVEDIRLDFTTPDQVKGLVTDQLLYINENFPQKWEEIQKHITEKQAEGFNTQELFDLLNEDQVLRYTKEGQVKFLGKKWQVQNCPEGFVQKLVHKQFCHLEDTVRIAKLSDKQIGEVTANDNAIIKKMTSKQVPFLQDKLLQYLLPNKDLMQAVDSKKLHHLSVKQINVRNVKGPLNQFKYRGLGLVNTITLPLLLVVEFIYHFAKLLFLVLISCCKRTNLKGLARKTFVVAPIIRLIAPLEIFAPAKYLKKKAMLAA